MLPPLIKFVLVSVEWDQVHGKDSYVRMPEECEGWVPFQVEVRSAMPEAEGTLTLAVWLRHDDNR